MREPLADDSGAIINGAFLPSLPTEHVPCAGDAGAIVGRTFRVIEPMGPIRDDVPLVRVKQRIDRTMPHLTTDYAKVAPPVLQPYSFEDAEGYRTLILDTTPDAAASAQEKARAGYVANPGLSISSRTNVDYGTETTHDVEDVEAGWFCRIATAGDTNWEAIGAAGGDVGREFVATGPGTGTGTVKRIQFSYDDEDGVAFRWTYYADGDSQSVAPHPALLSGTTYSFVPTDADPTTAKGEVFDGTPFLPDPLENGTIRICGYRYGLKLSDTIEYPVRVKIGRGRAQWNQSAKTLTLSATETTGATVFWREAGQAEWTEYESPLSITSTKTVEWYASKANMVSSDNWATTVTYSGTDAPADFDSITYSSLPSFSNSTTNAVVQFQGAPDYYISSDGTGDGLTPDDPASMLDVIGHADARQIHVGSGGTYRIAGGSGTPAWTTIGAPNDRIGTEFTATGAGSDPDDTSSAYRLGRARGPRGIRVTRTLAEGVDADEVESGERYRIATVGNTSWTGIGAASNAVGVEFVATGAGTGTGTADMLSDVSTLNLVRLGSEPPNKPSSVWREEIASDKTYRITDVGDVDWVAIGAPAAEVGVEFFATSSAAEGTGTAKELGRIEVSISADEVVPSALVAGDMCAIKSVGDTDWVAIGACRNEAGIEFIATGAGSGTGKAWRRSWDEYEGPVEPSAPCVAYARRLRDDDSRYSPAFRIPWFFGDVDVDSAWDKNAGTLTLSIADPVALDAAGISIYYGTDAADTPYTGPIQVATTTTYKVAARHVAADARDIGTESDEVELPEIVPASTASFSGTDTVTLTIDSFDDLDYWRGGDLVWACAGTYTSAIDDPKGYPYSEEDITVRCGYSTDFLKRDVQGTKTNWIPDDTDLTPAGSNSEGIHEYTIQLTNGTIDGAHSTSHVRSHSPGVDLGYNAASVAIAARRIINCHVDATIVGAGVDVGQFNSSGYAPQSGSLSFRFLEGNCYWCTATVDLSMNTGIEPGTYESSPSPYLVRAGGYSESRIITAQTGSHHHGTLDVTIAVATGSGKDSLDGTLVLESSETFGGNAGNAAATFDSGALYATNATISLTANAGSGGTAGDSSATFDAFASGGDGGAANAVVTLAGAVDSTIDAYLEATAGAGGDTTGIDGGGYESAGGGSGGTANARIVFAGPSAWYDDSTDGYGMILRSDVTVSGMAVGGGPGHVGDRPNPLDSPLGMHMWSDGNGGTAEGGIYAGSNPTDPPFVGALATLYSTVDVTMNVSGGDAGECAYFYIGTGEDDHLVEGPTVYGWNFGGAQLGSMYQTTVTGSAPGLYLSISQFDSADISGFTPTFHTDGDPFDPSGATWTNGIQYDGSDLSYFFPPWYSGVNSNGAYGDGAPIAGYETPGSGGTWLGPYWDLA